MNEQVVLITASTGIGAETAKLAAARGANVFVMSRSVEKLRDLAEAIRAAGGRCEFAPADVMEGAQIESAVTACVEAYGRIDAVFNVAGISGSRFGDGPIHACTEDGWDKVMDTNVRGMYLVCRAVINQLLQQEPRPNGLRGSVLNMASVLGIAPMPEFFTTHAYAASKGAIIAMSRSMAGYYAKEKIRVNVIAPGLVETPMAGRAVKDEAIVSAMARKQPLTGVMTPESIAEAALFMLSDAARAVTGDTFVVDGGWCVSG